MNATQYYITTVSWYNQLKIKEKALVGISAISFLLLVGISLSIHLVNKMHEESKEIHFKWMNSILKISEMRGKLDYIQNLESMHIIASVEDKQEVENKLMQANSDLNQIKDFYQILIDERKEKLVFQKFSSDLDLYFIVQSKVLQNFNKGYNPNVNILLEDFKIIRSQLLNDLNEMVLLNQEGELESNDIVDNSYYSLLFQMIITTIFTILFIYLVIYYTFKQFLFPLQLAEKATSRIAKGDWKVRIEYESKDELGNFIKTFNQMVSDHRKIENEKLRIEKEIRKSEELFRSLIDISPDAILLIGLDFSILWANNKMLRMFGYESISELRELRAIECTIPSEKEKVINAITSSLKSNSAHYSYESIAIRKDKSSFPIEILHSVYQNENVNIGVLTNIRDITERKIAEEALFENEERYKIITENMADVILILDALTMKLQYISPSVHSLTDYSVLEIMSLDYKKLLTPNSLRYTSKVFPIRIKRLLAGKKSLDGIYIDELEQYKKNGDTIWTEVVSKYIRNKKTGNLEVHAVTRNITERKIIQQEINEKSQMLSGILVNMPVVVFRVSESGIITQRIGAGLDKMGLSANKNITLNIYEVYSDFSKELMQALQGVPQVFISSGNYIDGNKWFFQNYFFLDESTNGLIGFGLDISEQMLAKQAAEEASKIKGEFLANISHEIRTPMNAILGFTELLSNSISDDTPRKYLENIISSGKTLLALINDILDLSKAESGKLELELSPINVETIFIELKNILSQKIHEKNLDFKIMIDPTFPKEIILDELRFRQIFLNLLSNAIKFTEKGYIKLTANVIKENKEDEFMDLLFTVQDTGIGIPEAEQSSIFEAFTQQKGQSHSRYGGTGLGLAISNRLIKLMNGQITVKSKVGKGSIFQIVIHDALESKQLPLHSTKFQEENLTIKDRELDKVFNPDTSDTKDIEYLKPLLNEMDNDLKEEWKKLSNISSINEIEEFAYKIKYLGDKYNYPPLKNYADSLQSKALLFDMNSLLILLDTYPELLSHLKANYVN